MANTKVPVELFDAGAGFTIGSGAEEDIKLIFDGNATDYYIGLRDSGDKFVVGKGQTLGTDQVFEISDGASSKPQVGVGSGGTNPMNLTYTGTALCVSDSSGTASLQVSGGNAARMDFGIGSTALFRMYTDNTNYTEFKRTTDHPIIFNTNNTEIARFMSTELKLASGKKLTGGASNVDLTIQSEHRIEFIGASKGTVILKDQGTMYGLFERPTGTNDFDIQNPIQDGDITFVGNDGGSLVTALTLDMSNSGDAVFRRQITLREGLYINTADNSATTGYLYDDSGDFVVRSFTQDKDIIFKGNDGGSVIEAMRIDYSKGGYVGINETSPDYILHVNSGSGNVSAKFESTDSISAIQFVDSGGLAEVGCSGTSNTFYPNGVLKMSLDSSGNLVASGNVTAYGSPSDIKLKENIEVIDNALDKVKQLKGITYDLKSDGNRLTGLIAQDLEKVLPEAVYTAKDLEDEEHLAIRYGNTVGLLVEAIKELEARVKELEAK